MNKTATEYAMEKYITTESSISLLNEVKKILLHSAVMDDMNWIGSMILDIIADEMIKLFVNIDHSERNDAVKVAFENCYDKILRHIYPAINANIGEEKWIKIMEEITNIVPFRQCTMRDVKSLYEIL